MDPMAGGFWRSPIAIFLVWLALGILVVVSLWKVFEKAGHPGWASLIPIYNLYIMLKIAGQPGWWLILMIIPFVNIILFALVDIAIAKAFGKGVGFGLGLLFLGFIFFPILAFGEASYAPQGSPGA